MISLKQQYSPVYLGHEWLGLLRTAETGAGSIVTDIVVNKIQGGSLIRVDAVRAGRDSTITSGTVSAGSERTKADIRYLLDSPGSSPSMYSAPSCLPKNAS